MATFTIDEYRRAFPRNGKIVRSWTIIRWINNKQLPSHHIPRKVHNRQWIIEINFDDPENLKDACLCFHKSKHLYKNNLVEWANTVAIKYNIDSKYFRIIHGI